MKRDMDLIRALMLSFDGDADVDMSDYSDDQQAYHTALILDAGLAKGDSIEDEKGQVRAAVVTRLTWEGHEFLDSARNDTIWNKAKDKLAKAGMDVGIDVLKAILKSLINEQLGIR